VPKGKWEEERYMLVCDTEKKVKRERRGYAKRQATFRHRRKQGSRGDIKMQYKMDKKLVNVEERKH
jgi:tRNA A37 N6-isopentenylltransferase MiaA